MDFVHDQLATGRKLRVLTIVDTFSRYAPAIEPRFSFRGADVVDVLERVGSGRQNATDLATRRNDEESEFSRTREEFAENEIQVICLREELADAAGVELSTEAPSEASVSS